MQPKVVLPSTSHICRTLALYLANHPLFIHPLVVNPVTNDPVRVSYWRLYDGLVADTETLVCSIYPYSNTEVPSPISQSASTSYMPFNLGSVGHEEVCYHILVKFNYNQIGIDQELPAGNQRDKYLQVPIEAVIDPDQFLLRSKETKPITLLIQPAYEVIGEYVELTRLAINEIKQESNSPHLKSVEMVYANIKAGEWERAKNVIFHQGFVMLKVIAYVSRGWRDKFILPVETIAVDYRHQEDNELVDT